VKTSSSTLLVLCYLAILFLGGVLVGYELPHPHSLKEDVKAAWQDLLESSR